MAHIATHMLLALAVNANEVLRPVQPHFFKESAKKIGSKKLQETTESFIEASGVRGFFSRSVKNTIDCGDGHKCKEGHSCCFPHNPQEQGAKPRCMKGIGSTCNFTGDKYCHVDNPIICGEKCCSYDEQCFEDKRCIPRRTSQDSELAQDPESDDLVATMELIKVDGWEKTQLHRFKGASKEFLKKLHHEVLPLVARELRDKINKMTTAQKEKLGGTVGQCFPLGFPSDFETCEISSESGLVPDACYDRDVQWIQQGVADAKDSPENCHSVGEDSFSMCNTDRETKEFTGNPSTESITHHYSKKETETVSVSLKNALDIGKKNNASGNFKMVTIGGEISTAISWEKTNRQTTSAEKGMSEEIKVNVGPLKFTTSKCAISECRITGSFKANISLQGNVE